MKDGRLNKCIDCTKKDSKNRESILKQDNKWIEKEKERSREKYHRLNYKEKHRPTKEEKETIINTYFEKYPEKKKAKILSSSLKKQNPLNHLHHWSYNDIHLKDCIEIEPIIHYFLHRHIEYDQERMMYRISKTRELLDSKEKHLEFIEFCKMNYKI